MGRAESGKDVYSTSGVGQSLGGLALPHESLSEAVAGLGDQFLAADFLGQGESLALPI